MRASRIAAIRQPAPSHWRQVIGFLLAALIALTVPGTAFDHVDAIFGPHAHDPVTRAALPLADPHGHPLGVDQGHASAEPSLHAPSLPTLSGLPRDLLIASWLSLLAPVLCVALLLSAQPPQLAGRRFGPAPPPPRR